MPDDLSDLVLLIAVISIVGPGIPQIIVVLGLLYGIAGSRIVRGAVVSVRESMYTHAAQSSGARTLHILWHHVLPNIMPVVIVLFTTRIGAVILAEAGLSFLGPARRRRRPGSMLSGTDAPTCISAFGRAYRLCLAVGSMINVYGDALRAPDSRMRGSR
jgi:peptide/nickel transport system permease protein